MSTDQKRDALTDERIETGWKQTFSTDNPFCPCNLKSFTKAVRWAEHALRAAPTPAAPPMTRAEALDLLPEHTPYGTKGADLAHCAVDAILAAAQASPAPATPTQEANP